MNATVTTELLPAEVALAARLVDAQHVPSDLFAWIRSPRREGKCVHDGGVIAMAIEEIVGPLARDADQWLTRELKHASLWYGNAIQQYIRRESPEIAKRQVLTVLLPLYRCLATGELLRSYTISRNRLAEIFFIVGMQEVLGTPLRELLDATEQTQQCPESIIASHLDFRVSSATGVALDLCARLKDNVDADKTLNWVAAKKKEDFEQDVAPWAEPALLWRLAGEVIDRKPNTILPRSWVDVPVPWPSVTDHWRRIESEIDRLLSSVSVETCAAKTLGDTPDTGAKLTHEGSRGSVEDLAVLTDVLEAELQGEAKRPLATTQDNSVDNSQVEATVACYSTAEIHDHNDPVFVSAVARTIAVARKEQRSLSLATIVILPDGDAHADCFDVGTDGIKRWQLRLIDQLSAHPEMPDSDCYVTGAGELIVTILDLDRGLATELIRESIIEMLCGASSGSTSLMKVDVQAKFHVGIATTSRPGASMSPEELIAPARRCFAAATSLGAAAIKSIEVY